MERKKDRSHLPWFKMPSDIDISEDTAQLWEQPGRNKYQILYLLTCVQAIITRQLKGRTPDVTEVYQLHIKSVARSSHVDHKHVTKLLQSCSMFGVEVLQSCNNFVTIRYDNYSILHSSGLQKEKENKINSEIDIYIKKENDDLSCLHKNNLLLDSPSENREVERVTLKKSDLTEHQKMVELVKTEEGTFRWLKHSHHDLVDDLNILFPDIEKEIIRDEVTNLALKYKPEKFKEKTVGFTYIVNCLNKSFNRQAN